MSESQLVVLVEDSAREGSWNAAAWLLERRWPERWVRPSARTVVPTTAPERDLSADEPDPFADVVDISKRRRPR